MPVASNKIACGLVLCAALSAAADDTFDAVDAEARRECVKAAPTWPARDRPPAGFQPCDAEQAYYGLEGVPDYGRARLCAFATPEYGVLAMIYANGRGVPRDYGLARKAVCEDHDAAPAETQGRLRHIDRMEHDPAQAARGLDLCDDATSGLMMGWCASLRAQQRKPAREARLAQLAASWTPPQQAAFADLRKALGAWIDAHDGEVDKSGTARAALMIAQDEADRDAFVDLVARADAGRVPALAPARARAADDRMNATWASLRATRDSEGSYAVTMKEILVAQRAWLRFRDAWMRFAALRWPALPASTWTALLTERRERELAELLGDRSR